MVFCPVEFTEETAVSLWDMTNEELLRWLEKAMWGRVERKILQELVVFLLYDVEPLQQLSSGDLETK